jgi:predicted CoA-binding protein
MNEQDRVRRFLDGRSFAVVGASSDRSKYGNKVLRAYLQQGRKVVAVNPRESQVERVPSFPDLASLPEPVDGVSIVTPPGVSEKVLQQAAEAKIRNVWLQPGAEGPGWRQQAERLGLCAVGGGPCVLVALHFREDEQRP